MFPFYLVSKYSKPLVKSFEKLGNPEILFNLDRIAYKTIMLFHNKFYFDII